MRKTLVDLKLNAFNLNDVQPHHAVHTQWANRVEPLGTTKVKTTVP